MMDDRRRRWGPRAGLGGVGPMGWASLGVLLMGLGACRGPDPVEPLNTRLTDAQHTAQEFPITHGSAENPTTDCAPCHGGLSSFSDFTCLSCHTHAQVQTDTVHRLVASYGYDSVGCLACHPTGDILNRADHTPHFPISSGSTHQDAPCAECHTGGTYDAFNCLDCHEHAQGLMDPAHAGVSSYHYESGACLSCHPDGTVVSRDEHTYFPIDAGSPHGSAECAQCHTTGSYQDFSCITCHEHAQAETDPTHDDVPGYTYTSEACLSCHPSGTAVDREDHTYFPIDAGSTHKDTTCAQCHTTGSYDTYSCIDCHDHSQAVTDPDHAGVAGYSYTSTACVSCHPDGTATSREEHTEFPIAAGTKHQDASCEQCHTTGSYSAFSCIDCHEHAKAETDPDHADVPGYTYTSDACLSCHPDGTVMSREDHTGFPIASTSTHPTTACEACHTSGTYQVYSCIECHEHAQAPMESTHTGVSGYTHTSSACVSCHPDGKAVSRQEHNVYFPITSGDHKIYDCEDCHKGQQTYETFTCIGCHEGEHTCAKMNPDHDEVRNYQCVDSACLSCHPKGSSDD